MHENREYDDKTSTTVNDRLNEEKRRRNNIQKERKKK